MPPTLFWFIGWGNKSPIIRMKCEQSIPENGPHVISNFSETKRWRNWIPNWWHIYLRNVLVHEAWNTVFVAMKYAVVLHMVNMWNKGHVVYKHLLSFLGKKECIIFITRKRQQRKSMPPINFRDGIKLSPTTIQVKAYSYFQVTKHRCKYLADANMLNDRPPL